MPCLHLSPSQFDRTLLGAPQGATGRRHSLRQDCSFLCRRHRHRRHARLDQVLAPTSIQMRTDSSERLDGGGGSPRAGGRAACGLRGRRLVSAAGAERPSLAPDAAWQHDAPHLRHLALRPGPICGRHPRDPRMPVRRAANLRGLPELPTAASWPAPARILTAPATPPRDLRRRQRSRRTIEAGGGAVAGVHRHISVSALFP